MKASRLLCLLTAAALLLCSACGSPAQTAGGETASDPAADPMEVPVNLQKFSGTVFDVFDTTVTLTGYCESQAGFDAVLDETEAALTHLHQLYDIYNTYPDLVNAKTLNKAAGQGPVEIPAELMDLLVFAKDMYGTTNGRMNIAMGSVLSIWHGVREYNNAFPVEPRLPDQADLEAAAAHCSIDDLVLDEAAGTAELKDPDMSLDLGAVAKGYATERVAQQLISEGHTAFVLNVGGNIRVLGPKPDGTAWNVGIANPSLTSADPVDSVSLTSGAVVTSGVYQRFFEVDGVRYHHIIDPDTLWPENRYESVTVVTEDSGVADALSTALFNMDFETGRAFAAALENTEVLWILPDETMEYTEGFHEAP